jgi:two-component system, cell cycle response regulator DivK
MAETILITEDNPRNMKLMEAVLKPHGYNILKAFDGEEALELAIREKPALILLDLQLPKLSGIEVTQRLKQMPDYAHIPIMAVTAYAMKGDKEKFMEAGFDAYVSKPINTRELPKMVAELLAAQKHDSA